ncbi:MAG: hypothetical protein HYV63_27675 [Candidatus Schekmanbacteria bacterium]|nr:hypothetical protein [Candidatus Schekmanbacteria bacterium]
MDTLFIVGETGLRRGGTFWRHKTHQNGLSVDIFVPLRDQDGTSVNVPTWPWDLFGYGLELDEAGHAGPLTIDFDALAELLHELRVQIEKHRLKIQRVILYPPYIPLLLKTVHGAMLGPIQPSFMRTRAWVRHDEHVHIDFLPRE